MANNNDDKKNVTLVINRQVYDAYRKLCKREGWIMSVQIERLIKEQL